MSKRTLCGNILRMYFTNQSRQRMADGGARIIQISPLQVLRTESAGCKRRISTVQMSPFMDVNQECIVGLLNLTRLLSGWLPPVYSSGYFRSLPRTLLDREVTPPPLSKTCDAAGPTLIPERIFIVQDGSPDHRLWIRGKAISPFHPLLSVALLLCL